MYTFCFSYTWLHSTDHIMVTWEESAVQTTFVIERQGAVVWQEHSVLSCRHLTKIWILLSTTPSTEMCQLWMRRWDFVTIPKVFIQMRIFNHLRFRIEQTGILILLIWSKLWLFSFLLQLSWLMLSFVFFVTFIFSSVNALKSDKSKILPFGKDLKSELQLLSIWMSLCFCTFVKFYHTHFYQDDVLLVKI